MRIKIGSRKSDLARLQAKHIGRLLQSTHSGLQIEYDFRESLGDKNLNDPLWKAPEKGLFTSDLAEALEKKSVDLVVHSWKDLPIEESAHRTVVGTCRRADPRDLLLVKKSSLPKISQSLSLRIFSSSPRREYCLTRYLPELWPHELKKIEVLSVRGNIPTRVRKLIETQDVDALVVAKAALDRLMGSPEPEFKEVGDQLHLWIQSCQWMILPLSTFPTAPAQGALAIEILSSRDDLKGLLRPVIDVQATENVVNERAVLKSYGGGCHQKIGCTILNSKTDVPVKSLIGMTDQGETLKSLGVLNPVDRVGAVWSTKSWDSYKVRKSMKVDLATLKRHSLILVSKAEALPKGFHEIRSSEQILWTAGLTTWRKLAQQGYWVQGCSDGLGLESPDLEFLRLSAAKPLLVTHLRDNLPQSAVPTYSLEWKQNPPKPSLEPNQALYIRSRMDFEMAQKLGIFDEPRRVYCGLGETFSFLQQFRSFFRELIAVHSEENL